MALRFLHVVRQCELGVLDMPAMDMRDGFENTGWFACQSDSIDLRVCDIVCSLKRILNHHDEYNGSAADGL